MEGVIVESNAVNDRDEKERPVGAAFGNGRVAAIVEGEEDVGRLGEVWEGLTKGNGVGGLGKHEGHGGTEEDNVRVGELGEVLPLEVSGGRSG